MTGRYCKDVFLYRKDHTAQETAAWLGIGVRTYQRMEKSVKEVGFWNDEQAAADAAFMRYDTDNINYDSGKKDE